MITEEYLRKKLDEVSAKLKAFEELKKKRGWRNKVDPLSLEYEDYRKTKLWKQIKERVMARDANSCQRCGGVAELVHHISYDAPVMLGEDDSKLIALCSGCHEIVHFTSAGVKRSPEEQIAALEDISLNELMPKVDLRTSPWKRPNWNRLTAIQKKAYFLEHNSKMTKKLIERRQRKSQKTSSGTDH